MKTFFLGILLLCSGTALAETCANGGGTVFRGVDGTRYCLSTPTMNWWTAFSWCKAAHGTLFDINEECYKVEGTAQCPNIANTKLTEGYACSSGPWTANLEGPVSGLVGTPGAFRVCSVGVISQGYSGWHNKFTDNVRALCTLDDGY